MNGLYRDWIHNLDIISTMLWPTELISVLINKLKSLNTETKISEQPKDCLIELHLNQVSPPFTVTTSFINHKLFLHNGLRGHSMHLICFQTAVKKKTESPAKTIQPTSNKPIIHLNTLIEQKCSCHHFLLWSHFMDSHSKLNPWCFLKCTLGVWRSIKTLFKKQAATHCLTQQGPVLF